MKIGSISENLDIERRVAITPDVIKKYKSLGLEVYISKNYALGKEKIHIFFTFPCFYSYNTSSVLGLHEDKIYTDWAHFR